VLWHGRQARRVCLKERKLEVTKPRLRKKGGGEGGDSGLRCHARKGDEPADAGRADGGISTRQYAEVLPEMASTCGVSNSAAVLIRLNIFELVPEELEPLISSCAGRGHDLRSFRGSFD